MLRGPSRFAYGRKIESASWVLIPSSASIPPNSLRVLSRILDDTGERMPDRTPHDQPMEKRIARNVPYAVDFLVGSQRCAGTEVGAAGTDRQTNTLLVLQCAARMETCDGLLTRNGEHRGGNGASAWNEHAPVTRAPRPRRVVPSPG